MTIHINDNSQVSDVQKAFNALFPYLKIELFKAGYSYHAPLPQRGKLPGYVYMADLSDKLPEQIELRESMTVLELEKLFEDEFGLHLQVFRKSGAVWLETTITDSWTLKQQNEHGMEISVRH